MLDLDALAARPMYTASGKSLTFAGCLVAALEGSSAPTLTKVGVTSRTRSQPASPDSLTLSPLASAASASAASFGSPMVEFSYQIGKTRRVGVLYAGR